MSCGITITTHNRGLRGPVASAVIESAQVSVNPRAQAHLGGVGVRIILQVLLHVHVRVHHAVVQDLAAIAFAKLRQELFAQKGSKIHTVSVKHLSYPARWRSPLTRGNLTGASLDATYNPVRSMIQPKVGDKFSTRPVLPRCQWQSLVLTDCQAGNRDVLITYSSWHQPRLRHSVPLDETNSVMSAKGPYTRFYFYAVVQCSSLRKVIPQKRSFLGIGRQS